MNQNTSFPREFGRNLDCPWIRPLCEVLCPRAVAFEEERARAEEAADQTSASG